MARFAFILDTIELDLPTDAELFDLDEAGDDEPIPLRLAMFLPTVSVDWSQKVLRGAIYRGDLQAEKIGRRI